jgi:hypothetical protein
LIQFTPFSAIKFPFDLGEVCESVKSSHIALDVTAQYKVVWLALPFEENSSPPLTPLVTTRKDAQVVQMINLGKSTRTAGDRRQLRATSLESEVADMGRIMIIMASPHHRFGRLCHTVMM